MTFFTDMRITCKLIRRKRRSTIYVRMHTRKRVPTSVHIFIALTVFVSVIRVIMRVDITTRDTIPNSHYSALEATYYNNKRNKVLLDRSIG